MAVDVVGDELIIDLGVAHFAEESNKLLIGHAWILGSMADQNLGPDRSDGRRSLCGESAVEADDSADICTRSGEFKDSAAAEAVTHRSNLILLDFGSSAQGGNRSIHSADEQRHVISILAGHLPVFGLGFRLVSFAVDVRCKSDVAELSEHAGSSLFVLIGAVPVVDDDDARSGALYIGVVRDIAFKDGIAVLVLDSFGFDFGGRYGRNGKESSQERKSNHHRILTPFRE